MDVEIQLRELYAAYLKDPNDRIIARMYTVMLPLATKMAAKRYGRSFSGDSLRVEEIAHDSVVRFIYRDIYKHHVIQMFGKKLWYEVRWSFDKKFKENRTDDSFLLNLGYSVSSDLREVPSMDEDIKDRSMSGFIKDMCDTPNGIKVLLDMVSSKRYSVFIKKIDVYVDRRWIYDHAKELRWNFQKIKTMSQKAS